MLGLLLKDTWAHLGQFIEFLGVSTIFSQSFYVGFETCCSHEIGLLFFIKKDTKF